VLVVDDDFGNRDMLARRLAARGFEVATAEGGQEALDRLASEHFELVLLDVMMPGISGLEVLKTIRQTEAASDLPVIMATARDASADVVEALRLGANDYVTKPLDFPVVLARVQTQLAVKHQKDEIARLAEGLEVRNRFIRNTFGRYLSDEVVEGLLESPEGLRLGGESRKVTILMSDLRGFTQVSERLGPEQVVRMLNTYLGAMAEIIMSYRGTIDEFIGDAILAIFGAPVSREDDPRRAIACAVSMQLAMQAVNAQLKTEGLPPLEMGIALHTGSVVVGNIGSQKRTKYGIVGPPVNLAGRIETYTVGGQVLVSEATRREAGPHVQVGAEIHVKGKGASEPITVYDLVGIGGEHGVFLSRQEEPLQDLARPARVRFWILEGKTVGDQACEGTLVRLSTTEAEMRLPPANGEGRPGVRPLSNLKIQIEDADGRPVPGDLYAKVIESRGTGGPHTLVRFTSVPPEVEQHLHRLLAGA
jgi:class 3 adenylate cyclase